MSLPEFLRTPKRIKRPYEKAQKKVVRKYNCVCPDFIEDLKKDLAAGWSLSYACRTIPNEVNAIKKSFAEFPELKKIYDDYLLSKTLINLRSRKK